MKKLILMVVLLALVLVPTSGGISFGGGCHVAVGVQQTFSGGDWNAGANSYVRSNGGSVTGGVKDEVVGGVRKITSWINGEGSGADSWLRFNMKYWGNNYPDPLKYDVEATTKNYGTVTGSQNGVIANCGKGDVLTIYYGQGNGKERIDQALTIVNPVDVTSTQFAQFDGGSGDKRISQTQNFASSCRGIASDISVSARNEVLANVPAKSSQRISAALIAQNGITEVFRNEYENPAATTPPVQAISINDLLKSPAGAYFSSAKNHATVPPMNGIEYSGQTIYQLFRGYNTAFRFMEASQDGNFGGIRQKFVPIK